MEQATTIYSGPYQINLSLLSSEPEADAVDTKAQPQIQSHFTSQQFTYGVMGKLKSQSVLAKIKEVGLEKLFVFPLPKKEPTELRFVEADRVVVGPLIQQANEELRRAEIEKIQSEPKNAYNPAWLDREAKKAQQIQEKRQRVELKKKCYKIALRHFERAFRIQTNKGKDTTELEQAIKELKTDRNFLKWEKTPEFYLPNEKEVGLFKEIWDTYRDTDDIYEGFKAIVDSEDRLQAHHHWMHALFHKQQKNWLSAMEDYIKLAEADDNPYKMNCMEKAYAMLEKATLEKQELILRIGAVRVIFEQALIQLSNLSKADSPTCFICYNLDEKDISQWLKKSFVPDLMLAGVSPIVSFRDLEYKHDLNKFQELARTANLAVIACTPKLKAKYQERLNAPAGSAMEIDLIKCRIADTSKANTNFPIFLKGTRQECLMTGYLEPIFGVELAEKFSKFSYFLMAFEIFASMRNIPRAEAQSFTNRFIQAIKPVLRGEVDSAGIIHNWHAGREVFLDFRKESAKIFEDNTEGECTSLSS